jgi:short subunit dehydrogenase-like uncharacterized protein
MSARSYDIVVYGAYGLTGKLLCEFVNKTYNNLKWGIAGKDKRCLEDVKNKLKLKESVAIFVADSDDKSALQHIVSQTKVLLSVAGPYINVGTPLIEACVAAGTHYCDITAELPFIREVIDKYHKEA